MEKKFIRVRSTKDIIITLSIIITGSVLVALPTSTAMNILGFFMIFGGIILALALRTGYKDMETGEKYSKVERFFAQSMREEIRKAITTAPNTINLSEEDKGNGIRLDIYHNKALDKAYVQLFEYIPYKYEPCSKPIEHSISEVNKII